MRFAHFALGGDIGHVFVGQLRCKHAGDITQFPATLFRFCCKKYAGCSDFLQGQVCWDTEVEMMEGTGPAWDSLLSSISCKTGDTKSQRWSSPRVSYGNGLRRDVAWGLSRDTDRSKVDPRR